ncbi:MAG: phosphate acyltransferase [Actinomycetota bacterium]
MSLLERWYGRAAQDRKRIVFADGTDPRAIEAADRCNRDGLVDPVRLDDAAAHLTPAAEAFAATLTKPVDLSDPLHVAVLLVATGEADGCIAGATRPTADVLRAGLRILGPHPGQSVSSCFLMVLPDGTPVAYGDCGVIPDPDDQQLASIAASSAATFHQLTETEPRVAMLSFSTKGSAEHRRVDKVRSATALARAKHPDLLLDGELQFDAAWVEAIGQSKAPDSPVAGRANVFIFPDLDSGNIAYKITERIGGAQAFGPLLQGMNGVLHDLSRGCSAEDMVNVAVIAALQAA